MCALVKFVTYVIESKNENPGTKVCVCRKMTLHMDVSVPTTRLLFLAARTL